MKSMYMLHVLILWSNMYELVMNVTVQKGMHQDQAGPAPAGLGSCWGMSTARPGSAMGQSRSARRVPLEAPAFGENLGRVGEALGVKSTYFVGSQWQSLCLCQTFIVGQYMLPALLPFSPMLKGSVMSHPPSCPIHALCWLCSSFDHMMSVTLKICAIQQVIKMWQMMRDTLWKNQPWLAGISTINKWMS